MVQDGDMLAREDILDILSINLIGIVLENVYREDKGSNNFTEVSQVGLEYIGNIGAPEISEVLDMAAISLELIDDEYILEVSNMDFADSILKSMGMEYEDYAHMLTLIRQKNIDVYANWEIE